jgi:phospholipase/carboxylesterase
MGPERARGRTILVGFSQGAYLAYYLALRHPDRVDAVCGIAGRAKAEVLTDVLGEARHVRVLHLHGSEDPAVLPAPCAESIATLAEAGLDARFELIPGGHEVTPPMVQRIGEWIAEGDAR